jgi:hypothetical protein
LGRGFGGCLINFPVFLPNLPDFPWFGLLFPHPPDRFLFSTPGDGVEREGVWEGVDFDPI